MGKSIWCSFGAVVGLGMLFAACSGSGTSAPRTSNSSAGSATFGGAGAAGQAGAGSGVLCMAGSKRCDGLDIKLCDETGTKETITQTCMPMQTCAAGACAGGSACVPNSRFCKDGAVWKCDANGAGVIAEQCAIGLFCLADGDDASCSAQACTPTLATCDGQTATTCNSDGSAPVSGGMDCSKSKQACYGGLCRDVACKDGTKICQHGDVYVCAHNGTDVSLLAGCHSDEVCDADMGSCRKRLCDPGKVTCDGTRAQTCNAYGSAWLPGGMDCATDGNICVSGTCKKQVCGASRSYCQDGNVYSCDSTGTVATLSQTCNSQSEHCTTYSSGSFGYCQTNACHAGETLCADNVIKVCNADGTLPASGTPCSDTQVCDNGQCKDRPCVLGNYFCKGTDVYYCDFSSPFMSLVQQCDADSACKLLGTSGASCAPLACSPSSSTCLGNQIGTCAANGQSLSAVTTDCGAAASVCTVDLKCAKSAADAIGVQEGSEVIWAGAMIGDVIDVDATRKLTEFSANLVLGGSRELRWIVYELGTQLFVPKVDKVVSMVTGSGFLSSGAFNVTLTAGKRYLLAVVISGGDAVDYIDAQPYARDVSFGTVTGRVFTSYPSSFDANSIDTSTVSVMKTTTELP